MNLELRQFVNRTIEELNSGLHSDWQLSDDIQFEVAMVSIKSNNGKLDFKIVSLGSNENYQATHKIKFRIDNISKKGEKFQVGMQQMEGFMTAMFKPIIALQTAEEEKKKKKKK